MTLGLCDSTGSPEKIAPREFNTAGQRYRCERIAHWNGIAAGAVRQNLLRTCYHLHLAKIYRLRVSPKLRILELGCGCGDLLAALDPSSGTGVDFSPAMIGIARDRHPGLTFIEADVHNMTFEGVFDVIILSDLINDLWDVQAVFERLIPYTQPHTRILINFHSHLWQQPMKLAQSLGLMTPLLPQNWLTVEDVGNLLGLCGFELIKSTDELLIPFPAGPASAFCNHFLARIRPFSYADLTHLLIARPLPPTKNIGRQATVSVIVPARNEEGNIPDIFARVPQMGGGTELIFVEGHSNDDTWGAILREMKAHPALRSRALRQPGKGKGDAVRAGFSEATGDILMILDADMTVPPEDLPRFYDAIASGKGEFINGVRLVYPMEKQAMRFLNLLGNKFFSLAFSWLLGQPVKDTLCGTKVLRKCDYEQIAANRGYFGEFDPFGDFDLLFGAAKLNLKHVEVPVRYRERTYGDTNISRFRHGFLLLKMVLFAAWKIKFA